LFTKKGDNTYPFVVTNKHVVMGMREGALSFLQREEQSPKLGQGFRLGISDWHDAWFGHPSVEIDIAVCPFASVGKRTSSSNMVWICSTGMCLQI